MNEMNSNSSSHPGSELPARGQGLLGRLITYTLICVIFGTVLLSSCATPHVTSKELAKNVYLELVDWHIVGLWVINCPVCWVRVANYNDVPVKDIKLKYTTYGYEGQKLTEGFYTLEYSVPPGSVKNFIEQYVGLVDLESDMLSIELASVEPE